LVYWFIALSLHRTNKVTTNKHLKNTNMKNNNELLRLHLELLNEIEQYKESEKIRIEQNRINEIKRLKLKEQNKSYDYKIKDNCFGVLVQSSYQDEPQQLYFKSKRAAVNYMNETRYNDNHDFIVYLQLTSTCEDNYNSTVKHKYNYINFDYF
jgi:hypothetical protein